ncbi:MAG: ATP-binding cassette domain-containing protein, partial [Oscillospiraceae bacterium]|nr:ATP-binding cassette domain-containing protein [Oscillospiraceae bacterium]
KVNYYLNKVGILEQSDRLPHQISGGQKQRCAIARAIACETNLIIADEPTGALDSKTSLEIMKLFCELNKSGKTIIIVTHDMDIANKCKRVVKISDGKIIT